MGDFDMWIRVPRGTSDSVINSLKSALEAYSIHHAQALIDLYRQNRVSVRIRIIDPDFRGLERSERNRQVWNYLQGLPEEIQSDVSMLLLLTPEETDKSLGNVEFEDPLPSRL